MMKIPRNAKSFGGRLVIGGPAPSKYRAKKTTVDGIRFDSIREAERYISLRHLLKQGEIKDLRLQVPYPIEVNGIKVCVYKSDFTYFDVTAGREIIEDVKGYRTKIFILKQKLMRACLGLEVVEV